MVNLFVLNLKFLYQLESFEIFIIFVLVLKIESSLKLFRKMFSKIIKYFTYIVFIYQFIHKFSGQVFARRKNNSLCYTYFYDQQTEQGQIFSYSIITLNGLDPAQLILHPHWIPSHFERLNRFNLKHGQTHFYFKRI